MKQNTVPLELIRNNNGRNNVTRKYLKINTDAPPKKRVSM
jgi:hypothetical protein